MIAILQPLVPHYRRDFFKGLDNAISCDIFCYDNDKMHQDGFHQSGINALPVKSLSFKGFLAYSPFPLCKSKYNTLVLMLNIAHITTWILLLTKFIHRKKIILWGHGISVKRYLAESENPSALMKWMISLADGIWFYTDTEQHLWKQRNPSLRSVSLNNTISDVDNIIHLPQQSKDLLRAKFGIHQPRVLIFCARFNIVERRIDLLEKLIRQTDPAKCGFIIIGDGNLKPDFSKYPHVYDFGAVYDRELKDQLFQMADIYYQPGWVGLSVVEAMAYGKPVFCFRRSQEILQCVEYAYVQDGVTGVIFDQFEELLKSIYTIGEADLARMSRNSKEFAKQHLSMDHMVNAGKSLIE